MSQDVLLSDKSVEFTDIRGRRRIIPFSGVETAYSTINEFFFVIDGEAYPINGEDAERARSAYRRFCGLENAKRQGHRRPSTSNRTRKTADDSAQNADSGGQTEGELARV